MTSRPLPRLLVPLAASIAVAGPATGATVEVTTAGLTFTPPAVTVAAGDTVRFTDLFGGFHTVRLQDGSAASPAGAGEFSLSFPRPGVFAYLCGVHGAAGMVGQVTVTGSPAPLPSVQIAGRPDPIAPPAFRVTPRRARLDLNVSAPSRVAAGNTLLLRVDVDNLGPVVARRVAFVSRLAPRLRVLRGAYARNPRVALRDLGGIPVGGRRTVLLRVAVTGRRSGIVGGRILVRADNADTVAAGASVVVSRARPDAPPLP